MTIISISFPWNFLLQTLSLFFTYNNGPFESTWHFPFDKEILVYVFSDPFVMGVDHILRFDDVLREAGTVRVVEIHFALAQRLSQTRTTVEIYVGVGTRLCYFLVFKIPISFKKRIHTQKYQQYINICNNIKTINACNAHIFCFYIYLK